VTFRLLYLIFVRLCPPGRLDGAAGRKALMNLGEWTNGLKFLIRDRDSKYTDAFDTVFTATGMRIIKRPSQAPRANAICKRWSASARCQWSR